MIPNTYLEEQIQSYFEAKKEEEKKSKGWKPVTEAAKRELNKKSKAEGFDKLYSDAALLLQEKTYRYAGKIPGALQFSLDDIIFMIKVTKTDPEFMEGITTPKQLAEKLFDLAYDVLAIANGYVETMRMQKGYSGKLAYEISDEERSALVKSIKNSLKIIYILTKKRVKVESTKDSLHTLSIRKVISYIVSKGPEIIHDLESITKDLNSSNSKEKAEATSNLQNLKAHFNSEKPIELIKRSFDIVKKYSGNESLVWPALDVEITSGDEYKSLFKYLDLYAKGTDKAHAEKWVSQFKNRSNADIKRKIIIDENFRKKLKAAVKANDIHKTPGEEQTISNLQKISKQLLKDNSEFKDELSKEGIKHTAIDEVVGLLATFIKSGALKVKVE